MGGVPDFTVDFADIRGFRQLVAGRSSGSRRNARRGADMQYNVDLTVEESVFGVDKEIEISRDELCDTCGGRGAEPGTSPVRCSSCNGTGECGR
jgi:molecular chaperone DnaJ